MHDSTDTYDATMRRAAELGADHGNGAASWYFDGNTTHDAYVRVYRGLEVGDPEVLGSFPTAPLSGECAGDPTPADILAELEVDDDDDAADDYLRAYEDAFASAVHDRIERDAFDAVHNPAALRPGKYAPIAYTFEAGHHCPDCAARRFGVDESGDVFTDAVDNEGNGVGAVAPWDEWQAFDGTREVLACGTCGVEIDTYEPEVDDDDDDDDDDVRDAARRMAGRFTQRTRDDGTTYTTLTDEADEWMRAVVRNAHGEMLPDDWRYDAIASAVEFIADEADWDDRRDEWADGLVDVYNNALGAWVGSHVTRGGFVDDARNEWGDDGADFWTLVQRGQLWEAREVFDAVASGLESAAQDAAM